GQHARESGHAAERVRVPDLSPARVIPMLLATAGVAARGLKVSTGSRGDPNVLPGGRDRKGTDPIKSCGVADRLPVGAEIDEPLAFAYTTDTRLEIRGVHQTGFLRRLGRRIVDHAALGGVAPGPPHWGGTMI